jgi:tRNA threonylcarbamoyl adenosine modification protein (Sua5/YciO/YrdC/YwlC family)
MAEIVEINPAAPEPEKLARAAELIRRGQVVAIPTDTVYGLAADPFNPEAVQRVLAAKGRPPDAPVLVLVDSVEMAVGLAKNLPETFHRAAEKFWPGLLTIVVDAADRVPGMVTAHTGRLGIRLPAAAIPSALIRAVGGPVTATSANRSGQPECRSAAEVQSSLGDQIALILDGGPSPVGPTSTVIAVARSGWEMIREGPIRAADLKAFFARAGAL